MAAGALASCVAMALAVAVALAQPARAAATVDVETQRQGDAVEIHATAVVTADAGTAWHVLTDYARYPDFIPNLRSSAVVARIGSVVTVAQSGEVALWPFRFPVDVTFEVHETPPASLESRAVAGSLRNLTSSYVLTPADGGTRLDYRGHVDPGFALFGGIQRAAIERTVTRQFRALADEIERRGADARSNAKAREK